MSEDSHIAEFVRSQPRDWLAGLQVADLLLLHLSRDTATHAQRSGASILLTAMALQRVEGFYLGLESAYGALGAARNQEPEADAARLAELFGEFRDMAKGDTLNMYNAMLRGLIMRDVTPAPELEEVFEAFDRAFALLVQPAAVNALLQSRPIEKTPTAPGEVTITLSGGRVVVRRGALVMSPELCAAYALGESYDEVQRLAKSLAQSTSQDVDLLDEDGVVLETVTQ